MIGIFGDESYVFNFLQLSTNSIMRTKPSIGITH